MQFRRAPPPRNRNKARRSFQRRGHQSKESSPAEGLEVCKEDETETESETIKKDSQRHSGDFKERVSDTSHKVTDTTRSSQLVQYENRGRNSEGRLSDDFKLGESDRSKSDLDIKPRNVLSNQYSSDFSPVWKTRSSGIFSNVEKDRNITNASSNRNTGKMFENPGYNNSAPSWINRNYALSKENETTQPKYGLSSSRNSNVGHEGIRNTDNSEQHNVTPLILQRKSQVLKHVKEKTPPLMATKYQYSVHQDSNNNGAPRENRLSGSRNSSLFASDNNNSYKTVLSSNSSLEKPVSKYAAFEAEATFSDKGGNYSFYTPNPLEQDSDDENLLSGNKPETQQHTTNICDESNKMQQLDTKSLTSSQSTKTNQSFGSVPGDNGTPLSGLGQSAEVTYKPAYHPGTLEKT